MSLLRCCVATAWPLLRGVPPASRLASLVVARAEHCRLQEAYSSLAAAEKATAEQLQMRPSPPPHTNHGCGVLVHVSISQWRRRK